MRLTSLKGKANCTPVSSVQVTFQSSGFSCYPTGHKIDTGRGGVAVLALKDKENVGTLILQSNKLWAHPPEDGSPLQHPAFMLRNAEVPFITASYMAPTLAEFSVLFCSRDCFPTMSVFLCLSVASPRLVYQARTGVAKAFSVLRSSVSSSL